jgi:hypothetical protein
MRSASHIAIQAEMRSLSRSNKWAAKGVMGFIMMMRAPLFIPAWAVFDVGKELPSHAKAGEPCCSSPASICFWFVVSVVAWGVLSLVGIFWLPRHPRQRLRACSRWLSAASPTGAGIVLSLRDHWPIISDRRHRVAALRRAIASR